MKRRHFLGTAALAVAGLPRATAQPARPAFRYCLNTATLQGFKLGIAESAEIASKAGYHALEPWLTQLTAYSGSWPDLRRRIADLGLTVESAIAFPQWIVDDEAKRTAAMEQLRREMDMVARIGGMRIAAPPAGATTGPEIALPRIVDRYRAVLELGDRMGVVPELEFWGVSVNLRRLADAAFVAMSTDHPKACVLPDVFHLYKGGSGFRGLPMLSAQAVHVLHMNDYPATLARETIADRDRVYPGDGVAPLKQLLADLHGVNPGLVLSLEVFNPAYWKGDALETARRGLEKMKSVAEAA